MMHLRKEIIIWCSIAIAYFVAIFAATTIYYRTTGDAPLLLLALHHESLVLLLFARFGKEIYMLPHAWQETVSFLSGMIYYAGTGALLGLLRHAFGKSRHFRGLFYAILSSMLGWIIGVWIDGHPPIFILFNPPHFL